MSHQSKSFADVERYCAEHSDAWRKLGNMVESLLVRGRDDDDVPIYLTKMRIKKPASAYLKTKRRGKKNLSDITDWIGLRVLCLFEQDIYPTHRFITELFVRESSSGEKTDGYIFVLHEITTFNWEPGDVESELEHPLRSIFDGCGVRYRFDELREIVKGRESSRDIVYELGNGTEKVTFNRIKKGSGYKSIHYLVGATKKSGSAEIKLEIQMRTLLQDVWGELEHALSYKKGKIHPHIKSSFQLLSDELQAKDRLLRQLREINDRELSFTQYAVIKSGPMRWLGYDDDFLNLVFTVDVPELKDFRARYLQLFTKNQHEKGRRTINWCEQVANEIECGKQLFLNAGKQDDPNVAYFLAMERAFILFARGNIELAKEAYEAVLNSRASDETTGGRNSWVIHFRLGELNFASGRVEQALVQFDRCQSMLIESSVGDDALDVLYVRTKLGTVYWALGIEYIEIAIDLVEQATMGLNKLAEEGVSLDERKHLEGSLLNNMAYFALEKFIKEAESGSTIQERFDAERKADNSFAVLLAYVTENSAFVASNYYDTLAWYCFNKYKAILAANRSGKGAYSETSEQSKKLLLDSIRYLEKAEGRENRSGSLLISSGIQREHLQEILTEANREGLGVMALVRPTPPQRR